MDSTEVGKPGVDLLEQEYVLIIEPFRHREVTFFLFLSVFVYRHKPAIVTHVQT